MLPPAPPIGPDSPSQAEAAEKPTTEPLLLISEPLPEDISAAPLEAATAAALPLAMASFTADPEADLEEAADLDSVGLAPTGVQEPSVASPVAPKPPEEEATPEALTRFGDPAWNDEPPAWLNEPEWDEEPAPPKPLSAPAPLRQPAMASLQVAVGTPEVQVAQASPGSLQEFPWDKLVAAAGTSLGQGTQALLKQAAPVQWNSGRLLVQCSNPPAFQKRKEELEALASGLAGQPVKLEFQEGNSNAASSIGSREREAKRQRLEELQQQALVHPLVQEALKRFPGAVVQEIVIDEEEKDV